MDRTIGRCRGLSSALLVSFMQAGVCRFERFGGNERGTRITATQDTGLFMEGGCGRNGGNIEVIVAALPGEESGGGTD